MDNLTINNNKNSGPNKASSVTVTDAPTNTENRQSENLLETRKFKPNNDYLAQSEENVKLENDFENKLNIEKEGSTSKPTETKKTLEKSIENESKKEKEGEKTNEKNQCLNNNSVKDENGFIYYKCRFCGITFNYMTTLKAHERVHNISQPYTCNKCGEAFHYMCELEYHAKQHLAQRGYKCDCGRTFYQYTDLLYHNHPGDEPTEASQVAAAAAAVLAALAPPVPGPSTLPHIDPSRFPCPEFAEKGFEPKHPMKVYSEVRSKPYICQYCSKSYADSRGLAYHMYSHRGEKLFNPRASRYLMCRNENSYISPGADI